MPSDLPPNPNPSNPPKGGRRRPTPAPGGNWIVLVIVIVLAGLYFASAYSNPGTLEWGEFYALVKDPEYSKALRKVVFLGSDRITGEVDPDAKLPDYIKAKLRNNRFTVTRPQILELGDVVKRLEALSLQKPESGKEPFRWYQQEEFFAPWVQSLIYMLFIGGLLAVFLFVFLLPRFRDPLGGGFLSNYIKSPAKRYERGKTRITFDDVAGMQNAKGELQEVVEFLRSPEKFQRLGAVVPKGVLLVGPPGTGKTLLARAVAGEAGVPFFSISGSEFIQMFVGVGASRVRDMFKTAKENAPCLTGDTVVTLSGGRQVTIQEMFERRMVGVRVPAMTDDFRLENATVIGITRKPCPDLYEITTGISSIKATGNHLFPVLRGDGMVWVRADELAEGDVVAAPRRIATPDEPPLYASFLPPERRTPLSRNLDEAGHHPVADVVGVLATDPREVKCSSPGGKLSHSDIIWVPIQRIERLAPVDYVYDLCLDRHHCFVANNLITHNCILFIDEIDAVGRMRGAGVGGGSDEREQTLNQILSEMDGFTPNETVIVMAATNRPDVLDSALLRPGRFDRHITIDRPTWQGRLAILKVHTRNKPLADDVNLEAVARSMIGMTGADLRNLANEAALLATREGKTKIDRLDFERAADRVMIGAKREELLSPEEKRRTAYHEAGHALVSWMVPEGDKPMKVSIVPRGRTGGVNLIVPDEDRYHHGLDYFKARLAMLMGGRAVERLVYGQPFAGAEMDLKQATKMARYMVTHWGMSERLGPMSFRIGEEHVFLGKEIQEPRDFSESTAAIIDEEVQRLLREADDTAFNLLQTHRDKVERLVEALMSKEELLKEEIDQIINEPSNNGIVTGPPASGVMQKQE